MNTKIKAIIITLIAAGSFATASIVPAVSQARDNNNYALALECERLELEDEVFTRAGNDAASKGQKERANYYLTVAEDRAYEALYMGCDWVSAKTQPASHPVKETGVAVKEVVATAPVTTKPVGPVKEGKAPVTEVITSTSPTGKTSPVPAGPVKEVSPTVGPEGGGPGPEVPPTETKVVGKTPVVSSKTAS